MTSARLRRAAGPHDAVGVRQARDLRRASSHLSLVSSGASALVAQGNQELIDLAVSELTAALPCHARRRAPPRRRRSREARDVLGRARASRRGRRRRRRSRDCSSPATGSTPDCPLRSRAPSSAATGRGHDGGLPGHRIRARSSCTQRSCGTHVGQVLWTRRSGAITRP